MAPGPLTLAVTVLEQYHVSPTPAPAPGQLRSLPLTFFDLVFWDFPPVQRLFFYASADLSDVPDFLHSKLPLLNESLAAALHHFYPLAGRLPCRIQECASPEVVYSDGDSVRLTVAVSRDDFQDLAGDHPRDTARLRPLLPPLAKHGGCHRPSQDVLAVQVTVFPGAGVCVGTTLHHAVADGSSYVHFLKTWAAIHRLGDECREAVVVGYTPPLFDRGVLRDDTALRESFIHDHRHLVESGDRRLDEWDVSRRPDTVLATFRFTDELLRRLGRHVESDTSARCSPYALLGVYAAADFGAAWGGQPRKVEIVSVERTGALALAESGGRNGDGGIEVGLALPRLQMEAFRAFHAELVGLLHANDVATPLLREPKS
uniref:Uncharacterized protein n=1 Tax=Oryza brachyantha TaxID=4533 RepID=J3KUT2_ORYBR